MELEDTDTVKFYLTAINLSHLLVNSVKKELNKHLKRHDLNHKHWLVMEMIYFNKANTPTKIADRVGLDISTLSRLLDMMEMRMLIKREHYELDGRISIIKLTKNGTKQFKSGLQIFNILPDKFKKTLSEKELNSFEDVENYYLKHKELEY